MRIEFNLENTVLRKHALYWDDVVVLISTGPQVVSKSGIINTPVLRSVVARGFRLDKTALRWSSAATAFRELCDKSGFRGE
jgi:hypothetical protein